MENTIRQNSGNAFPNPEEEICRCAVITDLHYSRLPNPLIPERRGELALELLRRVFDFYSERATDLFLVGGDCLNDPEDPEAEILLAELDEIFRTASAPVLVIPGNHDPAPEKFYRFLHRVPDPIVLKHCRFVPFSEDPGTAGYHTVRTREGLRKTVEAAQNRKERLIALQHVPLYPPSLDKARYHYENAAEIVQCMENSQYILSVSGHQHEGAPMEFLHGITYLTAPSLTGHPFRSMEIEIRPDGTVSSRLHAHCNKHSADS